LPHTLAGTFFGGIASFGILLGTVYFLGPHDFTEHRRAKSAVYLTGITALMSLGMLGKLKYPKCVLLILSQAQHWLPGVRGCGSTIVTWRD
jgi:hypothetical protein